MAHPARVTITAGSRVLETGGGQQVSVSVTYVLDEADMDVPAFVAEKSAEVEAAHEAVWRRLMTGAGKMPDIECRQAHAATGATGSANGQGDPPATDNQKTAIRGVAKRLGCSEADIGRLVRERFGRTSLDAASRKEASAILISFGQGRWPEAGDIVLPP